MEYIIFAVCAVLLFVTGICAMRHIDHFFGFDQSESYQKAFSGLFNIWDKWCIIVRQQEERHGTGKEQRKAENLF